MKPITKKILKRTGSIIGILLLLLISFGVYIYSVMPKPKGKPPVLQSELFKKPEKPFPVEGKYIFKSATELAELIRNKKATSLEIVQEHLNYIKNNNYKTNAFVWLFEQEALDAARKADEKVAKDEPLGLLHGVPVAIKEEFWVKGKYNTINSENFQDFIAPRNAAVVDAWLNEGAIILGTTNVPNMLFDLQTYGDIYPTASNPYDTSRTPGGSTGGGATAVASGFCPLSLGGDMGGSIRVPAAFCGIYGLKTTEGSMGKRFGSFPDTTGNPKYFKMVVAGPQARNIDDLELAWNALIKPWPGNKWLSADNAKPLNKYKIAYLDEWHFGKDKIFISTDIKKSLKLLTDTLKSQGISVTNEEPGNFAAMREMHSLLSTYMMFSKLPWVIRQLIIHDFKEKDNHRFDYSECYERMTDVNDAKYDDIVKRRDALQDSLEQFFKKYDFLILPLTPGPAIKKNPQHLPITIENTSIDYWDYFNYPMCFNATGHPALTIPLGLNKEGLPLAVQIVGPMYSEKQLIHFARLIQTLHKGYIAPE